MLYHQQHILENRDIREYNSVLNLLIDSVNKIEFIQHTLPLLMIDKFNIDAIRTGCSLIVSRYQFKYGGHIAHENMCNKSHRQ